MQKRTVEIGVVGYGLLIIYGLSFLFYALALQISFFKPELALHLPLFEGRFFNIAELRSQSVLILAVYFCQIIGFIGVVQLEEWGRKTVIAVHTLLCLVFIGQMVFVYQKIDVLVSATVLVYAAVIWFFMQPRLKTQFQDVLKRNVKRILVVDDDNGFLQMIRATLVANGYYVYLAKTGENGLRVAREKKPDLVVLDVILPGIKGREICSRLKEDKATQDIPVIFLTAKDSPDDVKAELEAGALTHLTKPVDMGLLIAEINKILST